MTKTNWIAKLLDYVNNFEFISDISETKDFKEFCKVSKNALKQICENSSEDLELVKFSKNHFEWTAFIKNKTTDKFVYLSIFDVRPTFKDNILVRTAKNEKDFIGGPNNFSTIEFLTSKIEMLTS